MSSSKRQSGFTLVEIMVVVLIILVIGGILLGVLSKAQGRSRRLRAKADLQTISMALEAYHQDFGDYPRAPVAATELAYQDGAMTLCLALVAPRNAIDTSNYKLRDGADGPGFRTRGAVTAAGAYRDATVANAAGDQPQGKVYGPYIPVEKFDLKMPTSPPFPGPPLPAYNYYVVDKLFDTSFRFPILYIPAARATPAISPGTAYAGSGTGYLFNTDQCGVWLAVTPYCDPIKIWHTDVPLTPLQQMQLMLGDMDQNGRIDASEKAASQEPFLLWMAGPDGIFGCTNTGTVANPTWETDDVANSDFDSRVINR